MSSGSRISEKINDLFLLTLSDLETTLISQVIKLNNFPQKLIEEVQLSINEFKQKMFSSLIQLIQLVSQYGGNQNREVQSIAEALEQQVVKYKQTHLLFQMKGMVNTKIKALLETLSYSQASNKQEIQKQVQLLTDSLQKIEATLNNPGIQSPQTQPSYITPLPRRQQLAQFSSQDHLTPILSEDAQKKAKVQFITPDQHNQIQFGMHPHDHYNTQFQHTPLSNFQPHFSLENSILLNKTLNSFNNENHELQQKDENYKNDNFRELVQNAFSNEHLQKSFFENQLPQFGGQAIDGSCKGSQKVPFENEFMTQCLESIPVYDEKIEKQQQYSGRQSRTEEDIPDSPKIRTHKSSILKIDNLVKSSNTKSVIHRKISTQSLSQIPPIDSPHSNQRQIKSTNAKLQVQRKNSQIDSVNLQSKFNLAVTKNTRENDKENQALNKILLKKPCLTPTVKKQLVVLRKQKSTGIIRPVVKQK